MANAWQSGAGLAATAVLTLSSGILALAQQPTATPASAAPIERQGAGSIATIHVQSRLVSVALNVSDEHGAPVGGLTEDMFQISEDDKPLKIAVFDRESSTPLEVVLALDASESVLGDERLEREAAKSFVKTLVRPQDRIDLMTFADEVAELVPFTNDPKKIDSGLGRIPRGDATALYDAIFLASQRLGEMPTTQPAPGSAAGAAGGAVTTVGARRVVVLITDGENTTHHGDYDSALEQAERAGAMVYSLIIVPIAADAGRNTGGEHALIQMARDTGGKFYYVEDKHDLAPAFEHVSDDLRTQYTVGYYAPQKGGDSSGLRRIHLELKDPALRARYTLRYRTAYYGSNK